MSDGTINNSEASGSSFIKSAKDAAAEFCKYHWKLTRHIFRVFEVVPVVGLSATKAIFARYLAYSVAAYALLKFATIIWPNVEKTITGFSIPENLIFTYLISAMVAFIYLFVNYLYPRRNAKFSLLLNIMVLINLNSAFIFLLTTLSVLLFLLVTDLHAGKTSFLDFRPIEAHLRLLSAVYFAFLVFIFLATHINYIRALNISKKEFVVYHLLMPYGVLLFIAIGSSVYYIYTLLPQEMIGTMERALNFIEAVI